MVISIDHGNRQVKVVGKIFVAGYNESDSRPPFGEDILKCNGKFYSLTDKRIPYRRDKSIDDQYYILTLFGIAYELERAEIFYQKDIIDIQLLVGLPPAFYGALYESFESYFIKDRQIVEFEFHGRAYSIYISEAIAYPQAYAAIMPIFDQISTLNRVTVLDLGGMTADYIQIKNGSADLAACDSLENGIIILYNQIKSKVSADYDLLLDESDIDAILLKKPNDFDNSIKRLIEDSAQLFINDLLGKLRERMIDLRTCKTVFVGGGSILLRKQIENSGKVGSSIFVDQIDANVKGYELLYKASRTGA